jgi:hypothetical protein
VPHPVTDVHTPTGRRLRTAGPLRHNRSACTPDEQLDIGGKLVIAGPEVLKRKTFAAAVG